MPVLTTYGGDPTPTGPEVAWVPGSMRAYAESIDPKLNNVATSQADRDARFEGLAAGGKVTCPALKTEWMSLGGTPTVWQRTAYTSGWVTLGFTFPTPGWTAGTWVRIRAVNEVAELRLCILYNGLAFTGVGVGGIPHDTLAYIPSAFFPTQPINAVARYGGNLVLTEITPSGYVSMIGGIPEAVYPSGGTLQLNAVWSLG